MSSSADLRFPLEERFLARVRINSNRFEDWKAAAQREIASVLENPKSWYYRPNDLKASHRPVYEQDAIRGFARQLDHVVTKDVFSLAHLETVTLDDIQMGVYATTTLDQRAVSAQLLRDSFLDAALLRVHEGRTASDPFHFVGLKWVAYNSPAPSILSNRDYVFFEYSGTAQDSSGRKVLFVYQKSFQLQGDELHEPDKGCTRGTYYQLATFRMEGAGVLYQSVGQLDPAADVPTWVSTRYMTEYFDTMKHLPGLASARALFAAGMVKRDAPSKAAVDNKTCVVCRKKFGMMRSKHGCRSCGQSMCKHCVTNLAFFNEEAQFSSAPSMVSENFCLTCIKQARDRREIDSISASLTKTNIAKATAVSVLKSDTILASAASYAPTTLSTTSSFEATALRINSRDGPRSSIERQVGIQHSDSGSSASGSARSLPLMQGSYGGDDSFHSPAASHTSSNMRAPLNQSSLMFEQMNESIRQQEELLAVIQQERAKMQAMQQPPPPPPQAYYTAPPARPMPVIYHAPVSPSSQVDEGEERFKVLV